MEYELNLSDLLEPKNKTIWDRPVPVVKRGSDYHCYISSAIEEPYNYDELCHVLEAAEADNTVYLHVNTCGGHIDSAFKIVASIKRSQAKVIARITGTVASAGTIISLKCDEVEVEDYTHFMIHNYSTGTQGKGHEVLEYINFNDKDLKNTFKDIYRGFLTDREITAVINGKDMWLNAEEVRNRLLKRLEKAA